jgi:hypothetical protein
MKPRDFSRKKISQSIASEEPNGHLLDYWMKARFAEWNTGRLEEAGRRLPRDADGATSQWGAKREKYLGGGGEAFVIYIFKEDIATRVILCFVKHVMCCFLVCRFVDKQQINTSRRITRTG